MEWDLSYDLSGSANYFTFMSHLMCHVDHSAFSSVSCHHFGTFAVDTDTGGGVNADLQAELVL